MTSIPWTQRWAGRLAASAIPAYQWLLQTRVFSYDLASDPGLSDHTEPCLFVFWHEYIAALLRRGAFCNLTLLVSQHRDAEWLNQTAGRLGYGITRGSSTRGGPAAIRRLAKIAQRSSIVITPDGPKGPRRHMAPGAVYLASQIGIPIVPVGVGISRAKRLSTWDKFAIPLPGSRVRIIFGPKIFIPQVDERTALATENLRVGQVLEELTDQAQQWAENRCHLDGYRPKFKNRWTSFQPSRFRTSLPVSPSVSHGIPNPIRAA